MSPPDSRRGRPLDRKTPPTDTAAASVTPSADTAEAAWRRNAAAVLGTLAHTGVPFTADDLTMLVGNPPVGRQLSATFATAVRRRLIVSGWRHHRRRWPATTPVARCAMTAPPEGAHPSQLKPENVDNIAGNWVTADILLQTALWYATAGR